MCPYLTTYELILDQMKHLYNNMISLFLVLPGAFLGTGKAWHQDANQQIVLHHQLSGWMLDQFQTGSEAVWSGIQIIRIIMVKFYEPSFPPSSNLDRIVWYGYTHLNQGPSVHKVDKQPQTETQAI